MRSLGALVAFVLLSFAAAAAGAFFPPGEWYASLRRPDWTPPDSWFGPVWTALYLMMGVSAWLVWRRAGWKRARGALTLFFVQLALNAAWTLLFFGLRDPLAGLVDIVALFVAIAATAIAFRRHSLPATLLLLPYLVWVGFATALNFALWRMNA